MRLLLYVPLFKLWRELNLLNLINDLLVVQELSTIPDQLLGQASPNQASFPKFKEGNSIMFDS
jgi:hypothetical protein